jgi:endonuclease/exonuclease/phosphatase family metal-dependent hydrolase
MRTTLLRRAAPRLLGALLLSACAARGRGAGDAITVLVYNMHAGKDAAGVDNLARVAAVVRDAGADVVLLQEVDRGTRRSGGVDQPATLARLTGYHASFGRSLDYDGGKYGIAVLSRWPVRRDTTMPLPIDPPQLRSGVSYEPRAAHWVTLDTPGGPLAVVNTHLDASREDHYRRQEIRTVLAIAERARAGGVPVLVGGDFNAEPGSAPHAAALAAGLRDAWLECGRGQALTYPDGVPVKRIDYLWLSGAARCEEGRVIESRASDHRPVVFRVRLR